MAKAPQTSRGNDRHGRHCHGENRNNQTKTKKPVCRIPCTGDTSGLSDQRSQTRHNKKANDDNDDNDVREPERQRQCIDNHDDPKCCECTRYSTCTLLVGRKGGKACASCLIAKRKCRNCRCLNTSCRNQRDDLSATCTTEVTMKKLFPTANGCGESLIPTPPRCSSPPIGYCNTPGSSHKRRRQISCLHRCPPTAKGRCCRSFAWCGCVSRACNSCRR